MSRGKQKHRHIFALKDYSTSVLLITVEQFLQLMMVLIPAYSAKTGAGSSTRSMSLHFAHQSSCIRNFIQLFLEHSPSLQKHNG
eukprot:s131_g29.t1